MLLDKTTGGDERILPIDPRLEVIDGQTGDNGAFGVAVGDNHLGQELAGAIKGANLGDRAAAGQLDVENRVDTLERHISLGAVVGGAGNGDDAGDAVVKEGLAPVGVAAVFHMAGEDAAFVGDDMEEGRAVVGVEGGVDHRAGGAGGGAIVAGAVAIDRLIGKGRRTAYANHAAAAGRRIDWAIGRRVADLIFVDVIEGGVGLIAQIFDPVGRGEATEGGIKVCAGAEGTQGGVDGGNIILGLGPFPEDAQGVDTPFRFVGIGAKAFGEIFPPER